VLQSVPVPVAFGSLVLELLPGCLLWSATGDWEVSVGVAFSEEAHSLTRLLTSPYPCRSAIWTAVV
jgi:hypothetical protein